MACQSCHHISSNITNHSSTTLGPASFSIMAARNCSCLWQATRRHQRQYLRPKSSHPQWSKGTWPRCPGADWRQKKMCYDCVMSFFVLRALDFLVVGCGWNLVALLCLLVTSCGGKHGFYAWEPTTIEETHNHANVVLSSPLHLKRHRNIMNYATCANLNAGLCWYQKLNQGTSRRIHSLLTVMCCSHWLLRR